MAEAYYVPLAPHNPQGPCSLAASCQIAACIPNFLIQEGGTRSHEDLLKVPFQQQDSYLPLPKTPGLGVEIDEDNYDEMIQVLLHEGVDVRRGYQAVLDH